MSPVIKRIIIVVAFIAIAVAGILLGVVIVRRIKSGKSIIPRRTATTVPNATCSLQPDEQSRDLCYLEAALQAKDEKLCNGVPDDGRHAECVRRVRLFVTPPDGKPATTTSADGESITTVTPLDSDSDGLSDADEARYHTDPWNPDSDRDGFADGAEVKNGFNPLGPGRL